MLETAIYLVSREIAVRSGLKDQRYRIADGRFVLDNKDLSRVRFMPDEYMSGLQGIEKVSEQQAQTLIAQNGYQRGDAVVAQTAAEPEASQENEEAATTEENGNVNANENQEEE